MPKQRRGRILRRCQQISRLRLGKPGPAARQWPHRRHGLRKPLKERIQFNDASLWTGGANPSGGYDVNEFGAYQNFGDLSIVMDAKTGSNISNFSRTLDLATATHLTTWKQDGVTFTPRGLRQQTR